MQKRLVTGSSDKMVPFGVWVRAVLEFLSSGVRAHGLGAVLLRVGAKLSKG